MDRALGLLCSYEWWRHDVAYAVLFGSLARGSSRAGDVDVAVSWSRRPSLESVLGLYESLSRHLLPLGLQLDLTVLDWDPPCELVLEVWKTGVLVYEAKRGLYLDDMIRRVMICYDWRLVEEKLSLLETAERVVLGGGVV